MPSPAASSRPADSDHGYTLLWDEPPKAQQGQVCKSGLIL